MQPLVTARLFPSSQTFNLPASNAIIRSPQSYTSPTVITASPDSIWLFAYFPGIAGPGIGCIWKRGERLDLWQVQEVQDKDGQDMSTFPMSVGVVAAEWLSPERQVIVEHSPPSSISDTCSQWVTDENGLAARLPPRGPRVPVAKPCLMLVAEDHYMHFWYLRSFTNAFRSLKLSLSQPSMVAENASLAVYNPSNGPGGVRVCVGASIALPYNGILFYFNNNLRDLWPRRYLHHRGDEIPSAS